MDENIVVVSHTATEIDADCAIAALADAGINAVKQYRNAPGGSTLFALPGAMGFGAAEGYDIIVSSEAERKAREVLIGAGFAAPADEEASEKIDAPDEAEVSEDTETVSEQEPPSAKGSALLMILFLAAAALFIIGIDKVIELIKSLF